MFMQISRKVQNMSINLKHRREALDLSIADLARQARVSWDDIEDLEKYGPSAVETQVVDAIINTLAKCCKRPIALQERMHLLRDDWKTTAIEGARREKNWDRANALRNL
jgi:predicted transcriptional regulator